MPWYWMLLLAMCCLVERGVQGLITYQAVNGTTTSYLSAVPILNFPSQNVSTNGLIHVNIGSPCQVLPPSNPNLISGSIVAIVIWSEAANSSCNYYSQIWADILKEYGPPKVIIFTSLANPVVPYTAYDRIHEPMGEVLLSGSLLVLVSAPDGEALLKLPSDADLFIEIGPNAMDEFQVLPGWLAVRWIFFICFAATLITSVVLLVLHIRSGRTFKQSRSYAYLAISVSSALKTIEFGVDPFGSTNLLKYAGWLFCFWYALFAVYVLVVTIVSTWLEITGVKEGFHSKTKKGIWYFLWATVGINLFLVTLFVGISASRNDKRGQIELFIIIILALVLISMIILSFVLGIRALIVLKSLMHDEMKATMTRKVTATMLFQLTAFVLMLIMDCFTFLMLTTKALYTNSNEIWANAILSIAILLEYGAGFYFFHLEFSPGKTLSKGGSENVANKSTLSLNKIDDSKEMS